MDKLDLSTGIEGKTFVVQGLGNVGYHSSLYMTQAGAKLVGVAEMEGTIYDPKGIDLKALMDYRKETGSVIGFGDSTIIEGKLAIFNIIILAALESQITIENAPSIKAKIIAEAANGPTTADARVFK